ncbi:hypothetical protein GCM10027019_24240 [Melaminivora jejuensis]
MKDASAWAGLLSVGVGARWADAGAGGVPVVPVAPFVPVFPELVALPPVALGALSSPEDVPGEDTAELGGAMTGGVLCAQALRPRPAAARKVAVVRSRCSSMAPFSCLKSGG